MAALTGNSVASSYSGLLKTTDNGAIDATLKNMTDGLGNATPLSMANNYVQLQAPTIELIESTGGTNLMMISPTNVYFEGAVDFTNASVTGIPGGAPGLVNGAGADSLQSAAALTTTPANASASNSIALGNNARALGGSAICIGQASQASNSNSVMLGAFAGSTGNGSTALGWAAGASTTFSVGIGRLTNQSGGNEQIAIGNFARANQEKGIAIGASTAVNAVGGVALGRDVVNAKADTVSVTELETQLAGGGITMKSPNGTEYKLTVSDAGALVIT